MRPLLVTVLAAASLPAVARAQDKSEAAVQLGDLRKGLGEQAREAGDTRLAAHLFIHAARSYEQARKADPAAAARLGAFRPRARRPRPGRRLHPQDRSDERPDTEEGDRDGIPSDIQRRRARSPRPPEPGPQPNGLC